MRATLLVGRLRRQNPNDSTHSLARSALLGACFPVTRTRSSAYGITHGYDREIAVGNQQAGMRN